MKLMAKIAALVGIVVTLAGPAHAADLATVLAQIQAQQQQSIVAVPIQMQPYGNPGQGLSIGSVTTLPPSDGYIHPWQPSTTTTVIQSPYGTMVLPSVDPAPPSSQWNFGK